MYSGMLLLIILIEWNALRNSISDVVVKCKQLWYAIYYTLSKLKNAKDFRLFHSVKEIAESLYYRCIINIS